jgi:hypothetical protein
MNVWLVPMKLTLRTVEGWVWVTSGYPLSPLAFHPALFGVDCPVSSPESHF